MKVLLINAVCGTGSTGHIVADIWKALKIKGTKQRLHMRGSRSVL